MNDGLCLHEIIYDDMGRPVDYRILDVNPRYEEILGLGRNAVVGKTSMQVYGTNDPPFLDIFLEVAQTGSPTKFETYFQPLARHFRISVFSPAKGTFATVFQDITRRKMLEEEQKEREERLRLAVEGAQLGLWDWDVKNDVVNVNEFLASMLGHDKHTFVSDRYLRDYGVEEHEVLGRYHYDLFPDIPRTWKDVHQRVLAGAVESSNDDWFQRHDGSITYTRWECRPWKKAEGTIGGMITYTEVTTERKEAELALTEAKREFESIFENSQVGIMLLRGGRILHRGNQRLAEILGYDSSGEMEGISLRQLHLDEEHYEVFGRRFYSPLTREEQIQIEYQLKRKDGSQVWCSC